jgi:hypothetical protein
MFQGGVGNPILPQGLFAGEIYCGLQSISSQGFGENPPLTKSPSLILFHFLTQPPPQLILFVRGG